MTDEQAERQRRLVPDNPIDLPDDHLPCEGCGVAVQTSVATVSTSGMAATANSRPPSTVPFARCSSCWEAHDAADRYVSDRPTLAARMGDVVAREAVESCLFGLTVLDKHAPADDLAAVLPRLHPAAASIRFCNR